MHNRTETIKFYNGALYNANLSPGTLFSNALNTDTRATTRMYYLLERCLPVLQNVHDSLLRPTPYSDWGRILKLNDLRCDVVSLPSVLHMLIYGRRVTEISIEMVQKTGYYKVTTNWAPPLSFDKLRQVTQKYPDLSKWRDTNEWVHVTDAVDFVCYISQTYNISSITIEVDRSYSTNRRRISVVGDLGEKVPQYQNSPKDEDDVLSMPFILDVVMDWFSEQDMDINPKIGDIVREVNRFSLWYFKSLGVVGTENTYWDYWGSDAVKFNLTRELFALVMNVSDYKTLTSKPIYILRTKDGWRYTYKNQSIHEAVREVGLTQFGTYEYPCVTRSELGQLIESQYRDGVKSLKIEPWGQGTWVLKAKELF